MACQDTAETSKGQLIIVYNEWENLEASENYCRDRSAILAPLKPQSFLDEVNSIVSPCKRAKWRIGLVRKNGGKATWTDGSTYRRGVDPQIFASATNKDKRLRSCLSFALMKEKIQDVTCNDVMPFLCFKPTGVGTSITTTTQRSRVDTETACRGTVETSKGQLTIASNQFMSHEAAEDYCRARSAILAPLKPQAFFDEVSKILQSCSIYKLRIGLRYENGEKIWSDGSTYNGGRDPKTYPLISSRYQNLSCLDYALFMFGRNIKDIRCDSDGAFLCLRPRVTTTTEELTTTTSAPTTITTTTHKPETTESTTIELPKTTTPPPATTTTTTQPSTTTKTTTTKKVTTTQPPTTTTTTVQPATTKATTTTTAPPSSTAIPITTTKKSRTHRRRRNKRTKARHTTTTDENGVHTLPTKQVEVGTTLMHDNTVTSAFEYKSTPLMNEAFTSKVGSGLPPNFSTTGAPPLATAGFGSFLAIIGSCGFLVLVMVVICCVVLSKEKKKQKKKKSKNGEPVGLLNDERML